MYNHFTYDDFKPLKKGTSYYPQNALSLAIACKIAYGDPEEVERFAGAVGFDVGSAALIDLPKGWDIDTQCTAWRNNTDIVLAFRGTQATQDWVSNAQFNLEAGPLQNTKVHEGMQDALFPSVIQLTNWLNTNGVHRRRLWITGHSLGGALASMYAGMLVENGYKVYGLYTFASPRPGDGEFQRQLNDAIHGPHWRVVNSLDPVPHLPFEPFYSHPGQRIILKEDRRETTDSSWMRQRLEALSLFVSRAGQAINVQENHKLDDGDDSYIPRLKADLGGKVVRKKQVLS